MCSQPPGLETCRSDDAFLINPEPPLWCRKGTGPECRNSLRCIGERIAV